MVRWLEVIEGELVMREAETVPSLDQMQDFVGGHIELVRLVQGRVRSIDMYINEEGKLLSLPVYFTVPQVLFAGDVIAGDAMIIGGDETTGDTVGLTDEEISRIQMVKREGYAYEFGYLIIKEK